MAEPAIRAVRDVEHLRGIGGHLAFKWPSITGYEVPGEEYELLDVAQWAIERKFHNWEGAISGGNGSLTRRRVCDDFQFTAIVPLDLALARPPTEVGIGANKSPFVDSRLEGPETSNFLIAIEFHLGDPTFFSHPELQGIARTAATNGGLFYFCPEVALDSVRIVNSARDGEGSVLAFLVKGSGSAPLKRYVDRKLCGSGAFGATT